MSKPFLLPVVSDQATEIRVSVVKVYQVNGKYVSTVTREAVRVYVSPEMQTELQAVEAAFPWL